MSEIDSMELLTQTRQELAAELVAKARAEGVELTGPDGLLSGLTKRVLEGALEAELTERPRPRRYFGDPWRCRTMDACTTLTSVANTTMPSIGPSRRDRSRRCRIYHRPRSRTAGFCSAQSSS